MLVTFISVIPLAVIAVGIATGLAILQFKLVLQLLAPVAMVQLVAVRVPVDPAVTVIFLLQIAEDGLPSDGTHWIPFFTICQSKAYTPGVVEPVTLKVKVAVSPVAIVVGGAGMVTAALAVVFQFLLSRGF